MTGAALWHGSCVCGTVTYSASAPSIFQGRCYCRDCHKESGTGHVSTVAVPDAALTVQGTTIAYTRDCDRGGTITHNFCETCGTTLFHRSSNLPGAAILRAGTLDGDPIITPELFIYTGSAAHWDTPPAGVPAFEKMPPEYDV